MSSNESFLYKTVTKGLLAVIAAAVLSSVLVFSCSAHAGGITITHDDVHSCQEHSMASAEESEESTWTAILPGPLKKVALAVAFIAVLFVTNFVVPRKLPVRITQRIRFMFWLWARSRPFISSKNFLPYFVAIRDA